MKNKTIDEAANGLARFVTSPIHHLAIATERCANFRMDFDPDVQNGVSNHTCPKRFNLKKSKKKAIIL